MNGMNKFAWKAKTVIARIQLMLQRILIIIIINIL